MPRRPQIRSSHILRATSSARTDSTTVARRAVSAAQQLWVPVVAGLVGVAVGGALTAFGIERQIQEQHSAEERSVRAEAYLSLVNSADEYAQRTDDVMAVVDRIDGVATTEQIAALDPAWFPWLDARNEFQDALNRVYIYGSSEGWDAALDLAETLPYAQGNNLELVHVDTEMNERYRDVLRVMCMEATVSPRAECVANGD